MTSTIEKFDKLKKHITTEEGKLLAKELRRQLVRSEKYSDKLDAYFRNTMDGAKPEDEAKELKLL